MASGSNYLTTYYAKRIIGDSAAASAASALLQTGTGIITNTWIISKTGRSSNYGIRYKYDYDSTRATPEGTADRIEFIGGRTNNNEDVASAWIQLDTGDSYILGNVGIGHDPDTYKLYVNGTSFFSGFLTIRVNNGQSGIQALDYQSYDDDTFRVVLLLDPSNGNHGIWSSGYSDGTTFTKNHIWLLVRSSDGGVQMNGNALSATRVYVTNTGLPSSGSASYYLNFSDSVNSGNQDIRNTAMLYLWRNTNSNYLNIGNSNAIGALTLWNSGYNYNIATTTLTAARIVTLPNSGGWIAVGGNGSSTGVGGQYAPVYLNSSGILTEITAGTTGQFYRGDKTWSNALTGDISIGSRGVTSGPSSITYSNRITIVPYFHTGGPWYIKSGDDSSNAYLALYYNTTQLMRIKHDGTQMLDWKGNASTATALTSNAGGTEQPIYFTGGKPSATSYALKATVNNGDENYVAYYSGARAISSSKAATTMIMPAHYYHNLYNNNPTTGTTVYVHYYNSATTSTNSFANLRVKSGTSYKVLAFGGDGALTWGGTMTASGTIHANGGYLKSTLNSNTVQIGSQNTGLCHITNSADIPFWFNKSIYMNKGTTIGAAGTQYRPFQLYLGRNTTSGSNALNANSPLIEFSNSDRSQYCQLIYDDNDSLMAPDSLTLVGNQNGIKFVLKNGPLWVQGGSTAGGNVNRLTTSAGMPAEMTYNTSRRGTQIYANGIAFCDPYNGNSNSDAGWIRQIEETANSGYLEIATGDDSNEPIYVRQYKTDNTVARTLTLLDANGYTTIPNRLYFQTASDGIYYQGTKATHRAIRFIDNTSGTDGNGVIIGAAGYVGIGSGESGDQSYSGAGYSPGSEVLVLSSDGDIRLLPTQQSGYNAAYETLISTNGIWVGVNGNTTREMDIGVRSGAGTMYMYSVASTTGDRGIYVPAHGSGAAKSVFVVDTNNAVTFYGSLSGNASSASTAAACTGNSATATALTSNAGDANTPVYFTGGKPSSCNSKLGAQSTNGFWGMGTPANNFSDWIRTTSAGIIPYQSGSKGSGHCGLGTSSWYFSYAYIDTVTSNKTYGAVWNDIAECRQTEIIEPGRVVVETGDKMVLSSIRLQSTARVISDTYGYCMGEPAEDGTPIAIAGRVLVYPYQNRNNYSLGDAVCAAPNGTVDIMTREEIKEYPDRIVGIVSEIPQYNKYEPRGGGGESALVDDRIWIYVR